MRIAADTGASQGGRGSGVHRLPSPRAVVIIVSMTFGAWSLVRAQQAPEPGPPPVTTPDMPYSDAQGDDLRHQICVRCHKLPPPDVLPRGRWRDAIARMWLRREKKVEPLQPGAAVMLTIPDEFVRIARWYREHAPEALPPPEPWPVVEKTGPSFRRHDFSPAGIQPIPAVSNVTFADVDGDARLELVVTDMRYGLVMLARPYAPRTPVQTLARLLNPAHASVVDLDGDGLKDILVADLGDFSPSDHEQGSVVWLRGRKGGGFAPFELGGFPRIADVEAADIDGDGKLDMVVAAFGWRKVGQTMALLNRTTDYAHPSFVPQLLDARAGAIHAIPRDVDGDGRVDVVVLIAQQHESVFALFNNGPGAGFAMETLYAAPHPNWGSTGMQLVDLDGDGDLDVLLSHGDTLDDFIVKPYHGIQWLENVGGFTMVEHPLATMPGVHRAYAADLDGDGDLDVVAAANIPFEIGDLGKNLASVAWLEQIRAGMFVRHSLETGFPRHATLDAADFDRDGDIDLAVGNFTVGLNVAPWFEVWENLAVDRATPPPVKQRHAPRRPPPKN